MRAAHVIDITTPKKFLLNGLWFGPMHPETAIIWIHGLSSSAFSRLGIVDTLIDDSKAVMTFNNRGHDTVTRVSRINPRKKEGYDRILAGGAHEVFTDSADDIQGAIEYARSRGALRIFLAGHSTGCQKAVYYASRNGNQQKIDGIILLAPISDYASALYFDKKEKRLHKGVQLARKLVAKKQSHTIVPGWWQDAQRFLSLHTKESTEELFPYAHKKSPKLYSSLAIPVLALFAEHDEYSDRKPEELVSWFTEHSRSNNFAAGVIRGVDHSFKDGEADVAASISAWMKGIES